MFTSAARLVYQRQSGVWIVCDSPLGIIQNEQGNLPQGSISGQLLLVTSKVSNNTDIGLLTF
jgi:hypothetical protein